MATVCLFSAQPQLADQVPPLGHLPKVLQAMNHRNNAIPKSAIRVVHALSDNEVLIILRSPELRVYLCPLDDTSECQSLSPVWLYRSVSVISKDGTYSLLNRKVGFKLHFIAVELTLRCITFYSTTVLVLGLSAVCSSHGIFGDHWPTDEWNEKASRYYWSGLWSN